MKIFQIIIVSNLITLNCLCQIIQDKPAPADQVFLHINKNNFYPGDTIIFQAYVRDRASGIFETKSLSLYALLLKSPDHTIDSARFRIINSSANGWLFIPRDVPEGFYKVIAFTSSMINYDPKFIYSTVLEVKRDPSRNIAFKNEQSKHFSDSGVDIDIRFLPESGTFLYGVKQRIAFSAYAKNGNPCCVEGAVFNQNNQMITDFKSSDHGLGLIEFVPNPGDHFFARLNGSKYAGIKWSLPLPVYRGITLRILENNGGIIDFVIRGQAIRDTFSLIMTMNDFAVFKKQVTLDSLYRIKIKTDELPIGTGYISILDKNSKTILQRAVLINYHKKPGIEVTKTQDDENINFTIKVKNEKEESLSSIVTVSVIDSAGGYSSTIPINDIESCFTFDNLTERISGSLGQLSSGNISYEVLDLLLMTFGSQKSLVNLSNVLETDNKNYDILQIRNTDHKKKEIKLLTIEDSNFLTIKSTDTIYDLKYSMLDPIVRQIMVLPDKSRTNINSISFEFPECTTFIANAKKIIPVQQMGLDQDEFKEEFSVDSAINIEAVTIHPNQYPQAKIVNKYQVQYRNSNLKTFSKEDFKAAITFEDILFRTLPYKIDARSKMVYLGSRSGIGKSEVPALIVIDDNPLWIMQGSTREVKWLSSYDHIAGMPASNISSVTILNGPQGYALYGEPALGGIIFVVTDNAAQRDGYTKSIQNSSVPKNDYSKPIRIYRSEINSTDERKGSTIYWNSELVISREIPAIISIPKKLIKGPIYLYINGASLTNIPISFTKKYIN